MTPNSIRTLPGGRLPGRSSQELPGAKGGSQEQPGGSQEQPGSARRQPGVARISQEAARSSQEAARSSQEATRSSQGEPGAAGVTQGLHRQVGTINIDAIERFAKFL